MKRVIKEIIAIVKAAPNTAAAVRSLNKFKRESLFLYAGDAPEHGPFVWYPTGDFTFNGLSLAGEGSQVFTEFVASVRPEDPSQVTGEHVLQFDFGQQLLDDAERICQVPINETEVAAFHRAATALAAAASEAAGMVARYIQEGRS